MRTTLNIDDCLIRDAAKATGVDEKTKLVRMGLEALIRDGAQKRLASLYGTYKRATVSPRRKAI